MRKTIGEVINLVIPYANSVDVRIMNGVPYFKANLSSRSGFTRLWLYVVQVKEHIYATCESRDDIHERFFPSGSITPPFVSEIDMIRSIFGLEDLNDISYKYDTVKMNLSHDDFLRYLINILFEYKITTFSPHHLERKLVDMDIRNTRLKRSIEEEFKSKKFHQGTIWDLLLLIWKKEETFSLEDLREKECKVIISRLKGIGLDPTVHEKRIINLAFSKRKGD